MDPVNILRDNKVLKTYCSHFLEADGEDKKHNWEEMTVLGLHLLDIPLEPVLGKIVLHSVVLRVII